VARLCRVYLTRKAFSVAKNELKKPEVMGLSMTDMSWIDGANSAAVDFGTKKGASTVRWRAFLWRLPAAAL